MNNERRARLEAAAEPASLDTFDLCARLREVRTTAGLSQRELARRTGITHTTISLVELGRVSPSVASLKIILSGIPMTLAEFFAQEKPPSPKWVFRAQDLLELSRDGVSLRQVGSDFRSRKLQMLHETYPAGSDTSAEKYSHEGEEVGIVVEGSIEITVGSEVCVLDAGDGYYFSSVLSHRFRNVSDQSCTLVSTCTPPTF